MNLEKKYLEENIWIIEDFLNKQELDWFKEKINDPSGWYATMRSPYKNILNKFLDSVPEYDEDGSIIFPNENSKYIELPIFSSPGGIWDRLESVLPKYYRRHATLQSFKFMTDQEIQENLNLEVIKNYGLNDNQIDFAMYWHQDPTETVISFSLYLNDDFEGGELEFEKFPIKLKPKAGMLIVIPGGEKYSHRVNKVLGPNSRHTLYGNSWPNPENIPVSTAEDC